MNIAAKQYDTSSFETFLAVIWECKWIIAFVVVLIVATLTYEQYLNTPKQRRRQMQKERRQDEQLRTGRRSGRHRERPL